jgi:hypothetical protein
MNGNYIVFAFFLYFKKLPLGLIVRPQFLSNLIVIFNYLSAADRTILHERIKPGIVVTFFANFYVSSRLRLVEIILLPALLFFITA